MKNLIETIRAEISAVYDELDGYDPDALGSFANKIEEILDKHKAEADKQNTAHFHDFYAEDIATYPPEETEVLIKDAAGDNHIACLRFDDSEDGGWGFETEHGDFITVEETVAWMPIPQHERDKNYIPVWEREDIVAWMPRPQPYQPDRNLQREQDETFEQEEEEL